MRRGLKIALLSLLGLTVALVLVAGLLLTWVAGTESGSRFAIDQARGFLPEGIDIGRVSGRLGGHLVIEDLVVDQPGMELSVARLWLRWRPGSLAGGILAIEEIGARQVRYAARPNEEPPPAGEPFALPEQVELPVAVQLDRLVIEDVAVWTAPEGEPVVVDRVAATGVSFVDSRFELQSLAVHGPVFSVDASAQLTAAGDYPLRANLESKVELQGYAPVASSTRLEGSLAALTVAQQVESPYNLQLEGTVHDLVDFAQPQADRTIPGESMTVDARLAVDTLQLAAVDPALPDATFSIDATVAGPVDRLDVQLDATGSDPGQRRFEARLAALVEGQAITIDTLRIRQPGRDGQLNGAGRVALAEDVRADLDVDWTALTWPLTGEPALRSPSGRLQLEGPLDDYTLSLTTRLEPVDAPAVDLSVNGEGSLQAAALQLTARTDAGRAEGTVSADWADDVAVQTELDVVDIDPAILAADWPGRLNLKLSASALIAGETVEVDVPRLEAGGELRNQPLSADAEVHFRQKGEDSRVTVDRLSASLGATRIDVQGEVGERADLRWEIDSDDLSTLLADLQGQLSGSGQVTGELPRVTIAASLDGAGLGYADNQLETLTLRANVDLSGQAHSTLAVDVRDALAAGQRIARVELNASGTAQSHELQVDLDAEQGEAVLAVTGKLDDPWGAQPVWQGSLTDGRLRYQDMDPWTLARSEPATVAVHRLQVGAQCWQAADARLCLRGHQDAAGLGGHLDLAGFDYAQLGSLLPESIPLEGALDATMDLSYPRSGPLVASADIKATQGTLRGNLEVEAADDAGAALTERPAAATLRIDVPDLAFLEALAPGVERLQGHIDGDLTLSGTLTEPVLGGALTLADAQAFVVAPGLNLRDIRASVEGRGRDGFALQASAHSGDGSIELAGDLGALGAAPSANLTLKGSDFQVLDNGDGEIFLSPDLRIAANAERIAINGEVHVPKADITPEKRPPSAVSASEDQVLVNPEEQGTAASRDLYANVRVTLGDEVNFEGYGLKARFAGGVAVEQEPDTPPTGTGEIRIEEGEYRAYGQGLVIESGRILFAGGPLTTPGLDLRAVRRPEEGILVGADVGGTLQAPTFELFSEPSMTEQEQLSYLVLGRSLEDSPEGENSALNQAILAMGLKGGDFLAKNIGQKIGVDQIGVQTGSGEAGGPSDPNDASLVVGKYLSPSLYVSYGIGLFDPESVVKLQYELSRRWKLVTETSGEASGADVIYTIER